MSPSPAFPYSTRTSHPHPPPKAEPDSALSASCLERSTVPTICSHSIRSDGWNSGLHRIAISTNRPGMKLFYRHEYYVGLADTCPGPSSLKARQGRSGSPAVSVLLSGQSPLHHPPRAAYRHWTNRCAPLPRFRGCQFPILSHAEQRLDGRDLTGFDRRIELDYGTCNFDENGQAAQLLPRDHGQVLHSADYARALDRGFPHILEFPASGHIALTRVVLRDRATGNLGAADVTLHKSGQGSKAAGITCCRTNRCRSQDLRRSTEVQLGKRWPQSTRLPGYDLLRARSAHSDRSSLPRTRSAATFTNCRTPPDHLPDFRELDPIGSLLHIIPRRPQSVLFQHNRHSRCDSSHQPLRHRLPRLFLGAYSRRISLSDWPPTTAPFFRSTTTGDHQPRRIAFRRFSICAGYNWKRVSTPSTCPTIRARLTLSL